MHNSQQIPKKGIRVVHYIQNICKSVPLKYQLRMIIFNAQSNLLTYHLDFRGLEFESQVKGLDKPLKLSYYITLIFNESILNLTNNLDQFYETFSGLLMNHIAFCA